MSAILTLDHVTKNYGKQRGITDISLQVEEGDVFGFIGSNGAGKSTTIRLILDLIRPTHGEITLFGKTKGPTHVGLRNRIGYMPSEALFYPTLQVGEVIKLSARLHGASCDTEAKRLCDTMELDTKKRVEQLSLGNRKKVSIVCALQHKPDLFILDEPTSGLDPLMQRAFFDLLMARNQEGATLFLSSHVLSEVKNYCKHTAIVREGKLLAVDTTTNLTKTSAKKVRLMGGATSVYAPTLQQALAGGMTRFESDDLSCQFLYTGDSKQLLKALATLEAADVYIEEPSLEEIFMQYYEKEVH